MTYRRSNAHLPQRSYVVAQAVAQPRQAVPSSPELFGLHFAEVIAPVGAMQTPELPGCLDLPGWEVRLWPVARLGDATLEARPYSAHLQAADLQAELERLGWTVLGPIRIRRETAPRQVQ